jgi:hypothetical protein
MLIFFLNIGTCFSQYYFNKPIYNFDTSISNGCYGWGSNVLSIKDSIYVLSSLAKYSNFSKPYMVLSKYNDTGKIFNSHYYFDDSTNFALYNQVSSNLIKTHDGGIAYQISSMSYPINQVVKTNIIFVKCNSNGDTVITKKYRIASLSTDSIVNFAKYIIQLPDSSYIISGQITLFTYNYDSNFIMHLSPQGDLLWERTFGTNTVANLNTGLWYQDGKIKIAVIGDNYKQRDFYYSKMHIFEYDVQGNQIGHVTLPQQSILIGKLFNKYNEKYTSFFGLSDTLNDYRIIDSTNYQGMIKGTELTMSLGLLDNQYRIKWRYLIPSDTFVDYNQPARWMIPSGSIRLHDGTILWYGCRSITTDYTNINNNNTTFTHWLLKTDSLGNRIWDRVLPSGGVHSNIYTAYTSHVCEADNGDLILVGMCKEQGYVARAVFMRVDSNGMLSPTDSGLAGTDFMGYSPYPSLLQTFMYPDAIIEIGAVGKTELKVFPNPAQNQLYIMYNIHKNGRLIIMDINGKTVLQKNINFKNNQLELDVSMLVSGMYILSIANDKESRVQKFIKAR